MNNSFPRISRDDEYGSDTSYQTINRKMLSVSIISVVYNGVKCLENTILSVINQTYNNIEYIIIDGGSTDGTIEIIKKYEGKISFWITESDKGIYDAMNKGISCSTGKWILFLNAGDVFINNTIMADIFKEDLTWKKLIYSQFVTFDKDKERRLIVPSKKLTYNNLINDQIVCHQTVFVRKNDIEYYNLKYKLRADYDWIIRNIKNFSEEEIFYFPKPSIYYLLGGKSSKQLFRDIYEINHISYSHFGILAIFYNLYPVLKRIIKFLINKK